MRFCRTREGNRDSRVTAGDFGKSETALPQTGHYTMARRSLARARRAARTPRVQTRFHRRLSAQHAHVALESYNQVTRLSLA